MSKFTIKIMGQVFESDEDGFLNLNDIHKRLKLPYNKRPSQWRDKRIVEALKRNANMHTVNGDKGFTAGDEKASIAYAMWISFDFYNSVIEAFIALRNGEIENAVEIAASTMSEADAHYLKRQSRLKGMMWDESCAWAGIKHSQKCREMLIEHPRFKFFDKHSGKYFVTEEGQETDYFYDRGNKFTRNTTMRVSPEGRLWLRENRDWFNKATEVYMNPPIVH